MLSMAQCGSGRHTEMIVSSSNSAAYEWTSPLGVKRGTELSLGKAGLIIKEVWVLAGVAEL